MVPVINRSVVARRAREATEARAIGYLIQMSTANTNKTGNGSSVACRALFYDGWTVQFEPTTREGEVPIEANERYLTTRAGTAKGCSRENAR